MSHITHHSQTRAGVPSRSAYASGCRCPECSAANTEHQREVRLAKGMKPRPVPPKPVEPRPPAIPKPRDPDFDNKISQIDLAMITLIEQRDRCAKQAQWWAEQARARQRELHVLADMKDDLLAGEQQDAG